MYARALRRLLQSSFLVGTILFSADGRAEATKDNDQPRFDVNSNQSLYEARNWIPRASQPDPSKQSLDGDRRLSEKMASSKSRPKKKRRPIRHMNLAQYKAKLAARVGIRRLIKPQRPANSIAPRDLRHVGGHLGLGGGNLEGAGFSARSPSEALAVCSFAQYGFPVLYQGVAKGRDGYFAYKIYRR